MTPHSNIRAWRIPGTEEPGGCCLGGHRESDTTDVTQKQQQPQQQQATGNNTTLVLQYIYNLSQKTGVEMFISLHDILKLYFSLCFFKFYFYNCSKHFLFTNIRFVTVPLIHRALLIFFLSIMYIFFLFFKNRPFKVFFFFFPALHIISKILSWYTQQQEQGKTYLFHLFKNRSLKK